MGYGMVEVVICLLGLILLMSTYPRLVYPLFIILMLGTEFFYIDIGGGVARPYQFVAVLVVVLLAKHLHRLISSRVFQALLLLVAVSIFAALMSSAPSQALASLTSFLANIAVAIATALILLSGKLDEVKVKRLVIGMTIVSVGLGLMQIVAFKLGGINLALSPEQMKQVAVGFGPGFWTEANTFGKYMVVPFFLLLPDYFGRWRQYIGVVYLILLTGILMNFTRSAIYGMVIASVYVVIWFAYQRKLAILTRRGTWLVVTTTVALTLILGNVLGVSNYAKFKVENFFDQEELVGGTSSAYRLQAMQTVLESSLSSPKMLTIGNGWGQTYTRIQGVDVQAGGGDLINLLGYSGLLGVIAYLAFMLAAFLALRRSALLEVNTVRARFATGAMFALVSVFVTAQISGYLISPAYWMLIGFCIYLDKTNQYSVARAGQRQKAG